MMTVFSRKFWFRLNMWKESGGGHKNLGQGILDCYRWWKAHNTSILLTTNERKTYLPRVGIRMRNLYVNGQEQNETTQIMPISVSYDQAGCFHKPFVEYYASEAFSIISIFFTLSWLLKTSYLVEMFRPSYNPFNYVIRISIRAKTNIVINALRFTPGRGGSMLARTYHISS